MDIKCPLVFADSLEALARRVRHLAGNSSIPDDPNEVLEPLDEGFTALAQVIIDLTSISVLAEYTNTDGTHWIHYKAEGMDRNAFADWVLLHDHAIECKNAAPMPAVDELTASILAASEGMPIMTKEQIKALPKGRTTPRTLTQLGNEWNSQYAKSKVARCGYCGNPNEPDLHAFGCPFASGM